VGGRGRVLWVLGGGCSRDAITMELGDGASFAMRRPLSDRTRVGPLTGTGLAVLRCTGTVAGISMPRGRTDVKAFMLLPDELLAAALA